MSQLDAHQHYDEANLQRLIKMAFHAIQRTTATYGAREQRDHVWEQISGYQARGQYKDAWKLTCDTFNTCVQHMSLASPLIVPWLERMITGYEARRRYKKAWKLTRTAFETYCQDAPSYLDASNSSFLSIILGIHRTSPKFCEGRPLLDLLPRDQGLQLLANQDTPAAIRVLVSKSLRDPQIDPQIEVVRLRKKGHEDILVRADVLCFWSEFFDAALSGRWERQTAFDLDPDNEYSTDSLKRIFDGFFHSGVYAEKDDKKREQDLVIADFYRVPYLLEILSGTNN